VLTTTFTPSPNFSNRKGARVEYIILHHTAGQTDDADMSWLTADESAVSAHYLIYRNGRVYQLVKEEDAAWHAGKVDKAFPANMNARSIGIELCHLGANDVPFTEAQYAALIPLLKDLVERYNVRPSKLLGHRDIAPGRKFDPADSFDWARVRKEVFNVA
jgi:N-acetylmuramoyl-L-alanine amidase